jgi:xanthine dehydrogenase accessory factor
MAPLTIALGPGFTAGVDVRCVIETMRGHDLGRILYEGTAMENTGVPGMVAGYGRERVIHAPASGRLELISGIGEIVEKGKIIAVIDTGKARVKVPASLSGVLRGILPENFEVTEGMKMADIDPRVDQVENCSKISDKARCIGGSVLQLVVAYEKGLLK